MSSGQAAKSDTVLCVARSAGCPHACEIAHPLLLTPWLLMCLGGGALACVVQASLSLLRAEWSSELAALKSDVEHKRRMAAAALKARQEEEDIKVRHRSSALRRSHSDVHTYH